MSFKALNLSKTMLDSLSRQKYFSPSDVQRLVIPKALKGESVFAQSATGSGKTFCFLIPIFEKIDVENKKTQALIIAPTKELARQIYDFSVPFLIDYNDVSVKLLTSGVSMKESEEIVKNAPQILIATPGRLKDILESKNSIDLSKIKTLVIDEADMLLKEGDFELAISIYENAKRPQTLVFSATLDEHLRNVMNKFVKANFQIAISDELTSKLVKHYLINIKGQDEIEMVKLFIKTKNPYLLIIFASTTKKAHQVYQKLAGEIKRIDLLTGELTSRERKNAIKRLRNGETYILVASDVAARGLDIPDVSDVLNIDLPNNLEYYFHRAGRTGRFDKSGNCYSFYNYDSLEIPLKLLEKGVDFNYLTYKDGDFVAGKSIVKKEFKARVKKDLELEKAIQITRSKTLGKAKHVKPGYKKRAKMAVQKVIRIKKEQAIRKNIRLQKNKINKKRY